MNAIFTVQHNESFYLPKWIRYYSRHFAPSDMYILAHNCTDITTLDILKDAESMGINVEYMTTDAIFDHHWLTGVVHNKQAELLKHYKYVVYTDCDEFIVPTDKTLREFLDTADKPFYRCRGYEVLTDKVYPNPRFFDKTLITSVPLTYEHGYHSSHPNCDVSDDLILFHIHRLDYEQALERNKRLASEKWDKHAIDNNLGRQNSLIDVDAFNKWFYEGQDIAEPSALLNKFLGQIQSVSIVSAYHNKEDMTLEFLENLSKVTPRCEVILTNAGSKPIDHPVVTQRVDLAENKSFSNSMNASLKLATGDYVCITNNDVFPSDGWIDHLVSLAIQTGAWITSPLNSQTNLASYSHLPQHDNYFECDMFPAVCWLVSRECIEKVGLFDEQFELGCYEDNDYCRRVKELGGKIVVDKMINVNHLLSQTISQFDIQQMMQANYQRYVNKWS